MAHSKSAVHRTILIVDIEGFGNRKRTNQHQVAVREGMYWALKKAFLNAGISWDDCHHEDRGDGIFVLVPPEQPKAVFVDSLPQELVAALHEHNGARPPEEQIRLRMALHAGEIHVDDHGATAASINLTFRLLDAPQLRTALADSSGVLALVVSSWFFDEVVRHSDAADPKAYRPARVEIKETSTIGWICLADSPSVIDGAYDESLLNHSSTTYGQVEWKRDLYGPKSGQQAYIGSAKPSATMTRTLPRDTAAFTGRTEELDRLLAAVQNAKARQIVAINAIDGMAGIGKTTFTVHAAHLLAGRFPDAQIFLRLHAHTPGQSPVEPVDALGSLLTTIGVAAQYLPAGLDARAAMWRDHLVGKRVLLVLDDAASHLQVESLLPATPGCLVLVTSRRRLIALDTTMTLPLDTLPPGEATSLFIRLSGRDVTKEDTESLALVIDMCGCLPLAISVLAGRLRHHPTWSIADLANDLSMASDRLDQIRAEDVGVTTAFNLSYRNLPPDQQRFFRYLGLHPGAELDAYSSAALCDISIPDARQKLEDLYGDHLLDEPLRSRYRMHDLVRDYSRNLAGQDPVDYRAKALERLLDYYQHAADAADDFIVAEINRDVPRAKPRRAFSEKVPHLPGQDEAWAWMHIESANLFSCAQHAAAHSHHKRAIDLAAAMAAFLEKSGPWDRAIVLHRAAVGAAQRIGEQVRAADALHRISRVQHRMADYPAAIATLTQALSIYREHGHSLGQAETLIQLAREWRQTDEYAEAAETYTQALAISRSLGDRLREARALNELGIIRLVNAEYIAAIDAHTQALDIFRALDDRVGQADAANELGVVRRVTGEYAVSINLHIHALEVYRDLNDGFHQALALNNLGTAWRTAGEHEKAIDAHTQALAIARVLGDRIGQAIALNELGAAYTASGNYSAAAEAHNKALDLYNILGHRLGMAETLNHEGTLLRTAGKSRQAQVQYELALDISREIGTPLEEARSLEGVGRCAVDLGQAGTALTNLRHALTIYSRIGVVEQYAIADEIAASSRDQSNREPDQSCGPPLI